MRPPGRQGVDVHRFAIFSDIHGNVVALDAVLADMDSAGVEERYCLGDLVGYGPEPAAVIDRIRSAGIPTIIGNYDEGVAQRRGDCGCYYATDQARVDGEASYAFTETAVGDEDANWLLGLPHEIRFEVEGCRVVLAHGSPRKINEYLLPDRSDVQLARLADAAGADLVCVGHVHIPYLRTLTAADGRAVTYVSSGSVGKPKDGDPRACWVELTVESADRISAIVHRVEYDVEAVAAAVVAVGLPATLADALRRA